MANLNSFGAAGKLTAGGHTYDIFRLAALEKAGLAQLDRIPFSIKILLENLLRFEDGTTVKRSDIEYVAAWDPKAAPREIFDIAALYRSEEHTSELQSLRHL